MTDLNESLARMRSVSGSLSARQATPETTRRKNTQQTSAEESAVDLAGEELGDIKANPVFQIMSKNNLSGDEKIEAVAKYLTVQNEDYIGARKRFAEFQVYFNHVQDQGMNTDMKGLENLIKEVKSALKPAIEKIVTDIVDVQKGVDESKNLLEVMRTARVEGKTIDQIKEAIDLNDKIIASIANLQASIGEAGQTKERRQTRLNEALDEKVASEQGFWNSIKRSVKGPDKEIAATIDDAQEMLNRALESVTNSQAALKAKEAERNQSLESGPLMILRSIDATETGFAENIVKTAENSLNLITGAQSSVQRLLHRMAYSKETALQISDSIAEAEVRQAILEGAVQRLAKTSNQQTNVIKDKLTAQDAKLAASEDVVEKAALNAERVGVAELQKMALAYEEDVKRSHSNFAMTTSNSVKAQSRASGFYGLLLAEEDMLQQLAARTLPETARALRMGLEVDVGMQTSEMASSISAITRRAIEIGEKSYKDIATTQTELRSAELKSMGDAIAALTAAQDSVVNAAEETVKHSNERGKLTGGLHKATSGLRDLLEQFDDIRTRAADPGAETPVARGAGPSRPASPANDLGASKRPEVA